MPEKIKRVVRIGGASGFWGDSAIATPQLLKVPDLQYLVYDYMAETTMSILARAREKDPNLGYATDFVKEAMAPNLAEISEKKVRVISNAGGLNPHACRAALLQTAAAQGISLQVAVVEGDDVLPRFETWREAGLTDMHTGSKPPANLMSANAYLGARSIAEALALGADIVITGRCVDSAVVLGALVYEFDWSWQDWDRLAAATLAGHVIECGAQATGGLFTDWEQVPGWENIGYPVIDCEDDGSFVLSKPEGTGGLIHAGAVSEQILYEVGDPGSYLMPDVTCDFRQVQVTQLDDHRVRVYGACGRAPTPYYKANGTFRDGYQINLMLAIRGIDAPAKAKKTAAALLARTRALMAARGMVDYSETVVELLGCEALYGPNARLAATREVVLRIGARHVDPKALSFLQRECASSGTSMGPGTRSSFAGRAEIQPVVKLFSFLVPKHEAPVTVQMGENKIILRCAAEVHAASDALPLSVELPQITDGLKRQVPLVSLAWARSGDKGNDENIGVIARRPEYLPVLREELTAERVRAWFAHLVEGEVERYDVPGLHALNFMLHQALGGGGVASLRSDPLGKSFAQMLLDMPISIPDSMPVDCKFR